MIESTQFLRDLRIEINGRVVRKDLTDVLAIIRPHLQAMGIVR